jgi:hypothetical protein
MQKIIAIILLMFFAAGCVIAPPRVPIQSLKASSGQGAKVSEESRETAREQFIKELSDGYEKLTVIAKENIEYYENRAKRYGSYSLAFTAGAICAGISVAALVAASPANAVWVAALSGASTGILSYQVFTEGAGYSREKWVELHNAAIKEIVDKETAYLTAFYKLKLSLAAGGDNWDQLAAETSKAFAELRSVVVFKKIPVGDVEKTEKAIKEIQQNIKDINQKIKDKNPGGATGGTGGGTGG